MTIQDEFSIVRGLGIESFSGDPIGIPCVEQSDSEKLCACPTVSVVMMAFNHERYIARAIEGVLMQKTDFDYELVIGEDCSSDRTREICFDYQNRHPDKIRVLWADHNVHNIGGNARRIMARCRGEFVAQCEGDDYWVDPLKLQKQVNIMRENPSVGLCFCGSKILYEEDGRTLEWNAERVLRPGLISGAEFFCKHLFGGDLMHGTEGDPATFLMTATTLMRKSVADEASRRYEIFQWQLTLGDTTRWLGLSALSDVYYLEDVVSVYFRNSGSALGTVGMRVGMDADLVRAWFAMMYYKIPFSLLPWKFRWDMLYRIICFQIGEYEMTEKRRYFRDVSRLPRMNALVKSLRMRPMVWIASWVRFTPGVRKWIVRFYAHTVRQQTHSSWIKEVKHA